MVYAGNVWTASSSDRIRGAWAIAQLGWIAGPTVVFLFSLVTSW